MTTVADIKSTFYDNQRIQANLFESLVQEIVALNEKLKEAEPKEVKKDEKKKV